jgi:quinoprotein glucose dehydrogenase
MVYATGGTRRSVVALDGKTGELIWVHAEKEGLRAVNAPASCRARVVVLDRRQGRRPRHLRDDRLPARVAQRQERVAGGRVRQGRRRRHEGRRAHRQGDADRSREGEIGLHSTPTVAKDVIIVGSSFREGLTVKDHNNTKGLVRAWDAKTGKLLWTFNTIPRPGEFGAETWEKESWAINGNTGAWTQIRSTKSSASSTCRSRIRPRISTAAIVPATTCSPTAWSASISDRPARHYQVVHHPIWDFDLPAAPLLADIVVGGKPVKAVALASKQGFLYVFDRVTGQPVWPIEEKPVPQTDVPGEKTAATQPFPSKPPAYSRNGVVESDLIDFTPELGPRGSRPRSAIGLARCSSRRWSASWKGRSPR